MKDYFVKMFEYDRCANSTVANAVGEVENPPEVCKELLFHIGACLDLWYNRIHGTKSELESFLERNR